MLRSFVTKIKKGGVPALFKAVVTKKLQAVVHLVFNWMCCHTEASYFFMLQCDVGIDHLIGEYSTAG